MPAHYLLDHGSLRASHGLDDRVLEDVRAVGNCLSARVPELIEDFYGWLSRLPEFGQFLSNEQLLARVKGHQAEYWRDFFRAEVDEAYVERRRVVGQVHARIELGLLIYLQAMEFVSAWVRREIEADVRLRDRSTATFSVRTLIQFDSAVVVDTYGARTARSLDEQRKRLDHVAGVMRAVTEGDLSRHLGVTGPDDVLGESLNDMVQSLRKIAREMGLIARGDYAAQVPPRSEQDQLGVSLQAMTRALRKAAETNEQQTLALRQQAVELERASRHKSEFLANMSHELRTPLNAIIGFSEVLKDGLMGELTAQQRGFIGDIFSSGNHLLSLINDILDLSKVEAGSMVLDLEPVQVSSLFVNTLSIIREKAAAHHIRLGMDADLELGSFQADARKVKQIAYNLLSNAVKFTIEGGQVTLRASRVPRAEVGQLSGSWAGRTFPLADNEFAEFLEISVTDSGIGISPEGLNHLFLPFSQIDSGLARKAQGTGLGLVMVKLLAELHGGAVAVASEEGKGSRFTVWLPLRAPEEAGLASGRQG